MIPIKDKYLTRHSFLLGSNTLLSLMSQFIYISSIFLKPISLHLSLFASDIISMHSIILDSPCLCKNRTTQAFLYF